MTSINSSSINFSDLINEEVEVDSGNKKESKYMKNKRRQPEIKVREDNLAEFDVNVERQLSKILDTLPEDSPAESNT